MKEDSFKNLFPLVVLSDSKKERDKITDGCFKIGLKVLNLTDIRDGKAYPDGESMAIEQSSAKRSLLRTKNSKGSNDSDNIVYIGPSSKIGECSDISFTMMVHNGFPRSADHLIKSVLFNGAKQHYFFSDKGFIKRRNMLLQELVEPACLLRLSKMLKRIANVQVIKLSVRSSPTFGSPLSINSNSAGELEQMQIENEDKNVDNTA